MIRNLYYIETIFFVIVFNLFPWPIYAYEAFKSGVRPQIISLPKGPGAIEGLGESFESKVNMGSGQYTVPLKIPPGRKGFHPSLSLKYNSGNGNGIAGIGWKISTVAIFRQTDKGLPKYNDANHPDTFINYNGEELVSVKDDSTYNIQTYRLKNENSFVRYEYLKNEDRWICHYPSGQRFFLGSRSHSHKQPACIRRPDDNLSYAWYVTEAIDTNGNRIHYNYYQNQKQLYYHSIQYGFTDDESSSRHEIKFEYENRTDPIIDYRPTFKLVTSLRLKKIYIQTSGKMVRTYHFQYLSDVSHSLLSKVTSIGNDGQSKLPPAEFSYSKTTPVTSSKFIKITGLELASIHISGDNPDYFPGTCELIDFNGDSLPDLYQSFNYSSNPFEYDIFYENQGSGIFFRRSFTQSESSGLNIQSENSFVQDINGDGLVDLVAQKGSNIEDFVFRLNNGGKWADMDSPFIFHNGETAETVFKNSNTRALDLNFDKKIDTLRSYQTYGISGQGIVFAAYINNADGTFDYISQTTSDTVKGVPTTFSNSKGALIIADMNGDRMQDIVLLRDKTNGSPVYWPSSGFGKFDDSCSGYVVPLTDGPDFGGQTERIRNLELSDLDGDGLADLYYIEGAKIRYWLNQGLSFGAESEILLNAQFDPLLATYRLADIDGDGLKDILFYCRSQPTPEYLQTGFSYVHLFQNNEYKLSDQIDNDNDSLIDEADEGNNVPNILCAITNGIGKTTSLLYSSHVEDMIRDRENNNKWSTVIPFPVHVIRRIDVHDGINTYKKEFQYHNGYYDGVEKEFRGFEKADQIEIGDASIPTLIMAYTFDTGIEHEALKGKPLSYKTMTENKDVFYDEQYVWDLKKIAVGLFDERKVIFPYQKLKIRNVMEKGNGKPVQLEWEYKYDNYGNLKRYIEYGRPENEYNDERVTVNSYTSDYTSGISQWIINKIVEKTITDENGQNVSQTRHYYDDNFVLGKVSKGNLTKVENRVDDTRFIITNHSKFDSYGNIVYIYDSLYGSEPGHYRELIYDDVYHTYPVEEIIYTGNNEIPCLTMSATYDYGFGKITSSTDFNGFTTTYHYDAFARITSIIKPPDKENSIEYEYILAHKTNTGKIINWIETRQKDESEGDGFYKSRTYFDGFGRNIMTRSEGEKTGQVVVKDTSKYNARQKTWKKYLPYFEPGTLDYSEPTFQSGFTEHFYDAIGREIRMNQPQGKEGILFSKTIYEPLTQKVQDEEQTKIDSSHSGCGMCFIFDGLEDKNGKGRLCKVFEIVKLSDTGEELNEPVEWLTTFSYDLLDNLTGYTDSQNNQKIIKYDATGRKIFMNDPDRGVMHYQYDDVGNLIKTIDAKNQVIKYEYDGLNRLIAEYYGENKKTPVVEYHYDLPYGLLEMGNFWKPKLSEIISEMILNESEYDSEYDLNHDNKIDVADVVKASKNTKMVSEPLISASNTKGFLSWTRDESGEEHNSYDSRGRLKWVVRRIVKSNKDDMLNFYTEMTYDSMDRVQKLVYPDGTFVKYNYNTRGLLESIPGVIFNTEYNPAGMLALIELSCGVISQYQYDERFRLCRLNSVRSEDGLSIQDYNKTYDGVSNTIKITDNRKNDHLKKIGIELGIHSDKAEQLTVSQSFKYDSLNRLTQASNEAIWGTVDYRYDRIGNMISKNANLHTPDPLMDLGKMNSGGNLSSWNRHGRHIGDSPGPHAITDIEKGNTTFTYDDSGNMTVNNEMILNWDYKDRLKSVSKNSINAIYYYDSSGVRKKKTVTRSVGNTTNVFYTNKYAEVRDGKLIKFVYFGNNRIARSDDFVNNYKAFKPYYFYLHDQLGSTNLALSDTGKVLSYAANYPFGHNRLWIKTDSQGESVDYQFIGKENDKESGLHYFEARYLLAYTGRFINSDPLYSDVEKFTEKNYNSFLRNPKEFNIYAYAQTNPLKFIDLTGYKSSDILQEVFKTIISGTAEQAFSDSIKSIKFEIVREPVRPIKSLEGLILHLVYNSKVSFNFNCDWKDYAAKNVGAISRYLVSKSIPNKFVGILVGNIIGYTMAKATKETLTIPFNKQIHNTLSSLAYKRLYEINKNQIIDAGKTIGSGIAIDSLSQLLKDKYLQYIFETLASVAYDTMDNNLKK